MMDRVDGRLPVIVLTGFLGSGKTTVLNHLLHSREFADTAVIINEFGEIGIDHLLVEEVSETLRVLSSGCLCCTVRGDLIDTLKELNNRRNRGEVAPFVRVIIETTGLADPAPVLHTLMADPDVTLHYRLHGVVTTVDAVNAAATFDRHAEAVKQAAIADCLLVTKTDLALASEVEALVTRLHALNPTARVRSAIDGRVPPIDVLDIAQFNPVINLAWLARGEDGRRHVHHDHHHDIQSHCIVLDEPIQEAAFAYWLELMAAMRGEKLLRVKGLVQVADRPDEPLVVHGVQHIFHPPRRLAAWPSADRRSRIVFITRGLSDVEIVRTFQKFSGVHATRAQNSTSQGAFHHD